MSDKGKQQAINDGWHPDLIEIGQEMMEELVRATENACKKSQNLKLNAYDARSLISLCLASSWGAWLCQMKRDERALFFEVGTKCIVDDLMKLVQDEIDAAKRN